MAVAITAATGSRHEPAAGPFGKLFTRGFHYPLTLALETDDNAPYAIALASELEARGGEPAVIRAAEFTVPPHLSGNIAERIAQLSATDAVHETRAGEARALIGEVTGKPCHWTVESIAGDPAFSIVQAAWAQRAQLIVLGIHPHGALEQMMGENTATRVIGRAMVPVIGVRPRMSPRPRRILVATDFGSASIDAAHIAANLAGPGGTIVLANVACNQAMMDDDEVPAYLREGREAAFHRLSEEIRTGRNIDIAILDLSGDVTEELLAAADRVTPDLIALASRRHSRMQRILMGGTSRAVVRAAKWPVLVTPPTG